MKVQFDATVPRTQGQVLHKIYLGLEILPQRHLVTYCVAICDRAHEPHRIIQKFHFDVETMPQFERKPICHLQLGGGIPPWLEHYKTDEFDTADARCEKPRIPCLPPSFALLANWILMEYEHVEDIHDFIRRPDWISGVRDAETLTWKKYFQHGNDHFGTTQGEHRCLVDRGYL